MAQSKLLTREGRKKTQKRPKRQVADPYNFDDWFNQLNTEPEKPIILVKGKDFKCMINSMAVQLRTAAANYGIKISINMPDEKHLVLRKRLAFGVQK